jgi:formylglycine-generating enzyme required for sulfatase activity/energy-coupling factor transporter ATP-binding protein EcfA2
MSILRILHISDLHIKADDTFDRSVVLDPLLSRISEDLDSGMRPELLIVTGDIAYSGKADEYKLAKIFLDKLLNGVKLPGERLFIVPGNHEIDRSKYRPKDVPSYDDISELNIELENKEFRDDLLRGMNDYFNLAEMNYPHLKSRHGRLVPFATTYTTEAGKKIGLIGLNSAWMCRRSPDREEIAIGEYQVKKAIEEIQTEGRHELIIYIFHHPLEWLWPKDMKVGRAEFKNDSIILCEHLHDAEGGYVKDLNEKSLYQFYAGAAYAKSTFDSNRFQYVTVDFEKNSIRIDFRKFVRGENKWCLNGEKGKDGTAWFSRMESGSKTFGAGSDKGKETSFLLEIPNAYRDHLIENCGYMDIDKLREKTDVTQVGLPEIFIPLYAYPPGRAGSKKGITEGLMREEEKAVEIEDLVASSEYLLIEGHAGSGKTTLLRHLCYCLARELRYKGLDGVLPLLIFMKDLKAFFDAHADANASAETAEALLEYSFQPSKNGLDIHTIRSFVNAGKAILILDGLDEIDALYRNIIVHSVADYRALNPGNKVILAGRPHGIEGAAVSRFGTRHVSILPLNMTQIEDFIKKWFRHVYSKGSKIGEKTAEGMISEIKGHPSIDVLTDNPLMLTAICILYHDGKELPGQRAELYKKFLISLLYKRFTDYEKVYDFLKTLAFRMQFAGVRGSDRAFAAGVLRSVYKIQESESEKDYMKRTGRLFDEIEPRCGLLKFERGQYLFWHLTFQEFLTAVYIVDNSNDYIEAIRDYWDKDNYKEVVELYIGYLSIENRKWANDVVSDAIKTEDPSFKRWILASRSMLDMHKDRRDEVLLSKVRKRLQESIGGATDPRLRVEAGETLGWLGDRRNLKEFIFVRAGRYTLSTGKSDIRPFEMAKYPVTNIWFEEFIRAEGYRNKGYWSDEGKKWLEYSKAEHPRFWNDRKWRCPNSPVVGVSWYEAYAFTKWLNSLNDGHEYRLPTEKEWEAAAAGSEKRQYPWGNEWTDNRCNSEETKIGKTSPVGVFLLGSTPEGIADMAGNVWEWTSSDYHSEEHLDDFRFDEELARLFSEEKFDELVSKLREKKRKLPVLRGGSWFYNHDFARCANRNWYNPDFRFNTFGFRCARTL